MKIEKKTCEQCGKLFSTRRGWQRFCSANCRVAATVQSPIIRKVGSSKTETGAASELAVAIDLMFKGYSVFRALCGNAPCDLIAVKRGEGALRVEVKTGRRFPDGSLRQQLFLNPENWDVYAVVVPDTGDIIYTNLPDHEGGE